MNKKQDARRSDLGKKTLSLALAAGMLAALLTAKPALSETTEDENLGQWSTELGLAALSNPDYQGASSYETMVVPYFDIRYTDEKGVKYFGNIPQGFGGYLYRERSGNGVESRVFASIAPAFTDRDTDDFAGLETFGTGVEARLGWELARGPFAVTATLAQELGAGHEGLYIDLAADWRTRIGERSFLSVGPTLRWADGTYMENLYGITAAEAASTGFAAYEAGSGIESAGIQGVFSAPLAGDWRLTTVLQVSRLLGDSRDSSLTSEPTQGFFLAAVTRRF